jgi:hypothetical protein
VVRPTFLTLAILGAMGLAAGPTGALSVVPGGSEAASALFTGALLLMLATVARRIPIRKE